MPMLMTEAQQTALHDLLHPKSLHIQLEVPQMQPRVKYLHEVCCQCPEEQSCGTAYERCSLNPHTKPAPEFTYAAR